MAPIESDHDFAGAPVRCGTGRRGRGVSGGQRSLRQPRGIHACKDGSLLVADAGNFCILRFKPGDRRGKVVAGEEGRQLEDIDYLKDIDKPLCAPDGEGFLLKQPADVCEDREGNVLVLDTESCRVQNYGKGSSSGRALIMVPPPNGPLQKSMNVPEAIKNPRSFTVCTDESLLVCDTWSHRVLRYEKDAEKPEVIAGTSNSCGTAAAKLCFPSCATFGPDGGLFVADTNNHRVQRFAAGALGGSEAVTIAGSQSGQAGSGLDGLNMPTGLCINPEDGALYVADRGNARVLRFTRNSTAGDSGEVIVGPDQVQRPWGLSLDIDRGMLFVSDEQRGVILAVQVGEPRTIPDDVEVVIEDDSKEEAAELEGTHSVLPVVAHTPQQAQEPSPAASVKEPLAASLVKGSPDELD